MNAPSSPAGNLAEAIAQAKTYWLDQFNSGLVSLINAQNAVAGETQNTDDKIKQQHAIAVSKAQGQMQSAMQQLAQVDTMDSDRVGRLGYNALAQLMQDTQKAASNICAKLVLVTALADPLPVPLTAYDAENLNHVTLYLKILDELSRIAPTTIWQQASSSSSA